MTTTITNSTNCTGCGACRLLCADCCITMESDSEGFSVPKINEINCTDCGVCIARCPANDTEKYKNKQHLSVLGIRHKNDEILQKSASGGIFAGIAAKILETPENAVFGSAFDEKIVAKHVCIRDIKDIELCQSSKYVQSDTGDTYLQAKELLDDGNTVFYTGCPCQIAGLYAFLGKDYDLLLTIDLICHGVPSPLLFKKYIMRLGKKFGGEIIYYNFRCKEKSGWGIKAKTKTKTKTIYPRLDPYYNSFLQNITHRECCYTCAYASRNRVGDITIGDFWGVELFHPRFHDARGVSVATINTSKGEKFFKSAHSDFEVLESSFSNASYMNKNLCNPSQRPPMRDLAYCGINDESLDIFCGGAYKIKTSDIIVTHIKQLIKKVAPSFALRAHKFIKHKIFVFHKKRVNNT